MKTPPPITQYLVSAVYYQDNAVTHFYVHQFYDPGVGEAHKLSKKQLRTLFARPGITVYTAQWNYEEGRFEVSQQVFVKDYNDTFHFYVLPEDRRTKDLRHLINLSWYRSIT